MKKTLHLVLFLGCVATAALFTNCNNKPSGNAEAALVDTPAVETADTAGGEAPTESVNDWTVIIIAETAGGAPIAGATARLKKMPGDTECSYDQSMLTDSTGQAKFTGTGSCPCKQFKAGVITDSCNKSKTGVVCEETVTFVCP